MDTGVQHIMWCVTPVYARGIGSGMTRVKLVDRG